jgi:hypothetical protein
MNISMLRWPILCVVASSVASGACSSGKGIGDAAAGGGAGGNDAAADGGPDGNDAATTGGGAGRDAAVDGGAGASEGGAAAETYDLALQFSGEVNGGSNPWSYGYTDSPGGAFIAFTINSDAATGSARAGLYGYSAVDPNATASGGDLVGWNGSESSSFHPAETAFYPFILKNVGNTPFVVTNNAAGPGNGITVLAGQIYACSGPASLVDARFTAPRNLTGRTIHAQFDRIQSSTTTYTQTVLVVVNGATLHSSLSTGNGTRTSFTSAPMDLKAGDTVDFLVQSVPDFPGASIAITAQIGAGLDGGVTD